MHKKLSTKLFLTASALFLLTASSDLQAWGYPSYNSYMASTRQGPSLLTFDDGSQWKVASSDQSALDYWYWSSNYARMPLEITPNYSSGSSYGYYLSYGPLCVQANLVKAPQRGTPYTITIKGFDKNNSSRRSIYLSNDTYWGVSEADFDLIEEWYAEDLVIIGKNSEWFTNYTHILINIHTNTFVRIQKL